MTLPPTLDREVIPNARPGTTWGNAVLLTQDLDKPAGLTTFPQDNDDYDDRALYHESHPATPADAALRGPLLTRHTPHGCPTFIPAFTPGARFGAVSPRAAVYRRGACDRRRRPDHPATAHPAERGRANCCGGHAGRAIR